MKVKEWEEGEESEEYLGGAELSEGGEEGRQGGRLAGAQHLGEVNTATANTATVF